MDDYGVAETEEGSSLRRPAQLKAGFPAPVGEPLADADGLVEVDEADGAEPPVLGEPVSADDFRGQRLLARERRRADAAACHAELRAPDDQLRRVFQTGVVLGPRIGRVVPDDPGQAVGARAVHGGETLMAVHVNQVSFTSRCLRKFP